MFDHTAKRRATAELAGMALVGLALVGAAVLAPAAPATADEARTLKLDVRAIGLRDVNHPHDADEVGALRFHGGLHISADDEAFGGLSGLEVSGDGSHAVAVGDQGIWARFGLRHGPDGRLVGVEGASIGPLAGLDGRPLSGKRLADAESLALDGEGRPVVGFERAHRLWLYPSLDATPVPLPRLPSVEVLTRSNSGIEALTRLVDGRFLAIAEREGEAAAWLGGADGWERLSYRAHSGYRPTGAATLPSGNVVVVERHFSRIGGVRIRLRRVRAVDIVAGAVLDGELLATLEPPLAVDNFEAVAARRAENGRTVIYLLSDDNFNAFQRTLLFAFELAG